MVGGWLLHGKGGVGRHSSNTQQQEQQQEQEQQEQQEQQCNSQVFGWVVEGGGECARVFGGTEADGDDLLMRCD